MKLAAKQKNDSQAEFSNIFVSNMFLQQSVFNKIFFYIVRFPDVFDYAASLSVLFLKKF